jgi:hypothetical protein
LIRRPRKRISRSETWYWDAPKQDKGKHSKFEVLWIRPFRIFEVFSNNTYRLRDLKDQEVFNGPVNGHFIKIFFS